MVMAIEMLMNEHRLIEKVLASLETFVSELEIETGRERDTLLDYANFFRVFADKCHHGKEEDRLFARMGVYGFTRDLGPVAVMLAEHEQGRELMSRLAEIGKGSGPLTAQERKSVLVHAQVYIPLLRAHIAKEDNILYPIAIQALPDYVMDELANEFEEFEREIMSAGVHEKFHALADSLIAAYPPDPAKVGGTTWVGCHSHHE